MIPQVTVPPPPKPPRYLLLVLGEGKGGIHVTRSRGEEEWFCVLSVLKMGEISRIRSFMGKGPRSSTADLSGHGSPKGEQIIPHMYSQVPDHINSINNSC